LYKFDIALAYGVMAHLKKEESLSLVSRMLEIADYVIVTAPRSLVQHENIDNSADLSIGIFYLTTTSFYHFLIYLYTNYFILIVNN